MKKAGLPAIIAIFFLALSFTACDDFFSSSWGNPRAFDAANVNVNSNNVDQWVRAAMGNPALAAAVAERILQELRHAPPGTDRAKLMQGGIRLAIESSGLGTIILSQAADILGDVDNLDQDSITNMLENIQNNFVAGGGIDAAELLAEILLTDVEIEGNTPRFTEYFVSIASPGDVAEAVMVLALGLVGDDYADIDIEEWSDPDALGIIIDLETNTVTVNENADDKQIALAAYLNLIADQAFDAGGNPLTSAVRDAFFGAN